MGTIYLDNAATSYPKPKEVVRSVAAYLTTVGANPGRSAHHLAVDASRIVFKAREKVAEFLGVKDSRRVVFGPNATFGLNMVLKGVLQPGDHVVTSSMEHNAVERPLRWLETHRKIQVTRIKADRYGLLEPALFKDALRPHTKLVVVNHASNVSGSLQDIASIKNCVGKIPLLVDAAQTAGVVPLHTEDWGVEALAFTGHKSFMGPQGTGGVYISKAINPMPLVHGGTGSRSDSNEQPDFFPDKYEGGTLNATGLAGLAAGLDWIEKRGGVKAIRHHELDLISILKDGLAPIPSVTIYGPESLESRVGVLSFTHSKLAPGQMARCLHDQAGVCCRVGLHCAPQAHKTLGTFPVGTVRLAPGPFNTKEEMERVVSLIKSL